jgi:hypothetical protein
MTDVTIKDADYYTLVANNVNAKKKDEDLGATIRGILRIVEDKAKEGLYEAKIIKYVGPNMVVVQKMLEEMKFVVHLHKNGQCEMVHFFDLEWKNK